jgi:hypothetical protein
MTSELERALRDPKSNSVRRNIIAHHTCDQLTCPHCHVGPGQPCVTFPRGTRAYQPHMGRVRLRLAQIPVLPDKNRP